MASKTDAKKTGKFPPGIREAIAEERDGFESWFTDPANQDVIDRWIAEAEGIAASEEGWIRVKRGTKTPSERDCTIPGAMGNVTIRAGDLFASQAQTLTNAVNTAGVMGAGIALAFKRRFPEMFADYARRCKAGEVKLGEPYVFIGDPPARQWVLNFPTKGHWRERSRLRDIRDGLAHLRDHHLDWGIASLAVPALGCGAGGLAWEEAQPVILEGLRALRIPVELYAPVTGRPPTFR